MFKPWALLVSIITVFGNSLLTAKPAEPVATFSIVAHDPETGELGVAVASRFFAVGSVVPWARADVGAVATQAYANTTYGPRGLELLAAGFSVEEVVSRLTGSDDQPQRRQFGIVDAQGNSATYTGEECNAWAGGRHGAHYACQGNILASKEVVIAMENAFLETEGTLAERMYAALTAGEAKGGDARGKQSAALLVVAQGAGYGGYNDRAIDIRVDDHPEPFVELGRLLDIALLNYIWNRAWTHFTLGRFKEALPPMEKAAQLSPEYAEVWYDLAVIRLAADDRNGARKALDRAIELNPKLAEQARVDADLAGLGHE